jgi:hypothetical protein
LKTGIFERRGREGCAENAEKKIQKRIQNRFRKLLFEFEFEFEFEFLTVFSLSSSAFSAKPSRPLRSKNPCIP